VVWCLFFLRLLLGGAGGGGRRQRYSGSIECAISIY